MRIISYNVNGIRSAINKGFTDWLQTDPADIICLQETKAVKENIDYKKIEELGYQNHWFSAQKKGYSGVAVFSKIKPDYIEFGNKIEQSDFEGRVIRADFGKITLINAYFPSGTSGDAGRRRLRHDECHRQHDEPRRRKSAIFVHGRTQLHAVRPDAE